MTTMLLRKQFLLGTLSALATVTAVALSGALPAAAQTVPPSYNCRVLAPLTGDTASYTGNPIAPCINSVGQVLGISERAATKKTPGRIATVLWNPVANYAPINIGSLPGDTVTNGLDINNLGQVVGSGNNSGGFLWLPTPAYGLPSGMTNLTTLVQSRGLLNVRISTARCLSDRGEVVLSGRYTDPTTGSITSRNYLLNLGVTPATVTDLGSMQPIAINEDAPLSQLAGNVYASDGMSAV